MKNELEYLGYNLSGEGIEVAPERIQSLIDAPAPANGSEVRGLLGSLVMLRRFDHQIAEETVFLNSLINSFNSKGEEERQFQELKECLRNMLKNPRNFRVHPTLPLIFETDASKKAIGAALIQEVKTEEVIEQRLIYTASRSLTILPRQDTQPSGENSWVSLLHSRSSGRF